MAGGRQRALRKQQWHRQRRLLLLAPAPAVKCLLPCQAPPAAQPSARARASDLRCAVPWICALPCSWEPVLVRLAAAQPSGDGRGGITLAALEDGGRPRQPVVLGIKVSELPTPGPRARTWEQLPKLQVPGESRCFDTRTSTVAPRLGTWGEVPSSRLPHARSFIAFCSHVPPCIRRVQLPTYGRGGCSPGWGRVIAPVPPVTLLAHTPA